ncbi:divalent-cation tolerance protein CutA [Propylenella binzhouense]|uniref:Divalent-cation tolerance protein CutA n=1 Tax=Propylenella binzhouense TaxID=2555902 RepID=A0A964WTC4_9HYPH|nr:divalent-cation tolerance protein CutA [Propylenella binzhouense]MYZ47853.1 divalent-cation tolerance protein CutA [Propylenella binzhouense]
MDPTAEFKLLYMPCPDADTAKRIGRAAVEARLAGCANILPSMTAIYEWEGAVEEAGECVLLLKTSASAAARLRVLVEREHPYEIPAVLTLPLEDANASYAAWLRQRIGPEAA